MKRTILLLALLLVACSPFVPTQPSTPVGPTAYIDPSYPTVQAQPAVSSQLSSGIEVTVDRAWRDGKQVNANVCFTLLDDSAHDDQQRHGLVDELGLRSARRLDGHLLPVRDPGLAVGIPAREHGIPGP